MGGQIIHNRTHRPILDNEGKAKSTQCYPYVLILGEGIASEF